LREVCPLVAQEVAHLGGSLVEPVDEVLGDSWPGLRRWLHACSVAAYSYSVRPRCSCRTPVPDLSGERRGVVAEGAVGASWAPPFRLPRYEIRLLHTGEIWNSNSVIAWALARSGFDAAAILPPEGVREPGWRARVLVADRPTCPGPKLRYSGTTRPAPGHTETGRPSAWRPAA